MRSGVLTPTIPLPHLCKIKQIATPKILHGGLRGATPGCDATHARQPANPATPCEDRQPPQNQLHLAECTCRKSCMWAAMRPLLKVRLMCKARHAPQHRNRSTAKSSKLHLPKICVVGCEVVRGGGG